MYLYSESYKAMDKLICDLLSYIWLFSMFIIFRLKLYNSSISYRFLNGSTKHFENNVIKRQSQEGSQVLLENVVTIVQTLRGFFDRQYYTLWKTGKYLSPNWNCWQDQRYGLSFQWKFLLRFAGACYIKISWFYLFCIWLKNWIIWW